MWPATSLDECFIWHKQRNKRKALHVKVLMLDTSLDKEVLILLSSILGLVGSLNPRSDVD